MSMTTTDRRPEMIADNSNSRPLGALRRDGLVGLLGRMRHRDPAAYAAWMEERDMLIITATLLRLNDRQLGRIGMNRSTLALDVEDLATRCARERELAQHVLELVSDEDGERHSIAAE